MKTSILITFLIFAPLCLARKWAYVGANKSNTNFSSAYQTLDDLEGDGEGVIAGFFLVDNKTSNLAMSLEASYKRFEYEEKLCDFLAANSKLIMTDTTTTYGGRIWYKHFVSAKAGIAQKKMERKLVDRNTGADITTASFQWSGTAGGVYLGVGVSLPLLYVYPYADITRYWMGSFRATETEFGVLIVF